MLGQLVADVRANPRTVSAPDGDGILRRVRVDAQTVVQTVFGAGYVTVSWRDIIGAARSWLAGDRRPFGRLAAETLGDPDIVGGDVRDYSEGLYLAVTCHDYPQAWDVNASFAVRRAQWEASRAALPPDTFAPFTTVEWTTLPIEGLDACLEWPAPPRDDPPIVPGTPYPTVPVLVLNGDLDIVTTTDEAQAAAARFPNATYVEIHNSVHVTALGDRDNCASQIMYTFVRTLQAGDTSCRTRVPEVRTIIEFPKSYADVTPATPRAGNRGLGARAPGGGRRRDDRGRRGAALAGQLLGRQPRPARRALELLRRPQDAVRVRLRPLRHRCAGSPATPPGTSTPGASPAAC